MNILYKLTTRICILIFVAINLNAQNIKLVDQLAPNINCIAKENNILWLGTDINIIKYNSKTEEKSILHSDNCKINGGVKKIILGKNAEKIVETKNGSIYLCSESNWIKIFDSNHFKKSNNITINNIAIDHSNSIWIATNNGLFKSSNKELINYSTQNTFLPDTNICSVIVDKYDNIWVKTSTNILCKLTNNEWTIYPELPGGGTSNFSIKDNKDGELTIIKTNSGFKYSDNVWKLVEMDDLKKSFNYTFFSDEMYQTDIYPNIEVEKPNGLIFGYLSIDEDNTSWVIPKIEKTNLYKYSRKKWTKVSLIKNGLETTLTEIKCGNNNVLWAKDFKGRLLKREGNQWKKTPVDSLLLKLNNDNGYDWQIDKLNFIWIMDIKNGFLIKTDGKVWQEFHPPKTMLKNNYEMYDLVELTDENGYALTDKNGKPLYDYSLNYPLNYFNAFSIDRYNNKWIAGIECIYKFNGDKWDKFEIDKKQIVELENLTDSISTFESHFPDKNDVNRKNDSSFNFSAGFYSIQIDSSDKKWLGTRLKDYDNEHLLFYNIDSFVVLKKDFYFSINDNPYIVDSKNRLCILTDSQLVIIKDSIITKYQYPLSLDDFSLNNSKLHEDENGMIWINCSIKDDSSNYKSSLIKFDGEKWHTVKNFNNQLLTFFIDKKNHQIWIHVYNEGTYLMNNGTN